MWSEEGTVGRGRAFSSNGDWVPSAGRPVSSMHWRWEPRPAPARSPGRNRQCIGVSDYNYYVNICLRRINRINANRPNSKATLELQCYFGYLLHHCPTLRIGDCNAPNPVQHCPSLGGNDYQRRAMIGGERRRQRGRDWRGRWEPSPAGAGVHRWGQDRRAGRRVPTNRGRANGEHFCIFCPKSKNRIIYTL